MLVTTARVPSSRRRAGRGAVGAETAPAWCPPGPGAPHRQAWVPGPGKAARPWRPSEVSTKTWNPARGGHEGPVAELASECRGGHLRSHAQPRHHCPPSAQARLPALPRLPLQTPSPRHPRDLWGFQEETRGWAGGLPVPAGPHFPRPALTAARLRSARAWGASPGKCYTRFYRGSETACRERVPLVCQEPTPGRHLPSHGHTGMPGRDLQGGCRGPHSAEGGSPRHSGLDRPCGSTAPQPTGSSRAARAGQSL